MRSERQKEILAQLEAEKRAAKRGKGLAFFRTAAIIYVILAAAFVGLLWWLDVLPAKYFYGGAAILLLVSIFIVPVMFSINGKRGRKIGATVAAVLLIGVFGVGTYYLADTLNFLGNITQVAQAKEDYYVVVKADAAYEDVSGLSGQMLATYMSHDLVYSEAKSMLKESVQVEYAYTAALPKDALKQLAADEYPAAFISAAAYESMKNSSEEDIIQLNIEESTRILHTISVPIETEEATSAVDVTKESYNIYISGSDMEGSIDIPNRTDVNMLATVNPVTNEVLLTSIPRDYYVELPSKGEMDKLTHSSLYGIQESVAAIEKQLGIEINYYLRVNYSTVMKLVDAIGGIEIESDRDFYTSGMKGMPELNGLHFVKGTNRVDGKQALAFCRERHSFMEGDMARNENQQQVMEAIIKKCTQSTTILTKYTSLLEAVKDNLSTNMTTDEMAAIVKMQIDKMPSWKISKQAIKGNNNSEYCYSLGFNASTVDAIPELEMKAIDEIVRTASGAVLAENGDGQNETSEN